jgi:(S)-2-hydroxyglutarate dehydrogenase
LSNNSDIIIIGGGIVGLATAYQLVQKHPKRSVTVLDKESKVSAHQTGHNSGVMHSGIYYKPGSLKASNCRTGKQLLQEFCAQEGIPFDVCGKIIVATAESELERLQNLFERGKANGVNCRMIDARELKELEPYCNGIKAVHVPESGIVSYPHVCERLAALITEKGNRVVLNAEVTGLEEKQSEIIVQSVAGEFTAQYVVNCAGLHSDRVAGLSGRTPSVKIIPFRGEYFKVKPEAEKFCRNLIYPVPDPQFPFLGVHFTRMIEGGVECGPNAVLAYAREGYRKTDINLRDLFETLGYPGFRKMAFKHWKMGMGEIWRSYNKHAFVKALQRLVPDIRSEHLFAVPAGIRAQAIAPDGKLVDDFAIDEQKRLINILNAPSPAATAGLSIGRMIVSRLEQHFN